MRNTEMYYVRTKYNRNGVITSRSSYCKRCGKRLYLVDKYGGKRDEVSSEVKTKTV